MPPRNITSPWSTQEVQTFLGIIGEERVQRELDGMVRNEKVFKHVSERMAAEGFQRTPEQCRVKNKKLWSDYRKVKDHNSRSGVQRKNWKWLDMMDAIYGHRPASLGRGGGIDAATSLLESMMEPAVEDPSCQEEIEGLDEISTLESSSPPARTSTPTPPPESAPSTSSEPRLNGKRKRGQQDVVAALVEMQAADERQQEWLERMEDRRDRRFEMMLDDAREARRHEAEITRQHMEQSASFNQAFLGTLSQLVQALNSRREPVP